MAALSCQVAWHRGVVRTPVWSWRSGLAAPRLGGEDPGALESPRGGEGKPPARAREGRPRLPRWVCFMGVHKTLLFWLTVQKYKEASVFKK